MYIIDLLKAFLFQETAFSGQLKSIPTYEHMTQNNRVFSLWNYKNPDIKKMIRHMKSYRSLSLSKEIGLYASEYLQDHLAQEQQMAYFINPIVIPHSPSPKTKE